MCTKRRSRSGVLELMPKGFNSVSYQAIHDRLCATTNTQSDVYAEYQAAWQGTAYRFLSCVKHSDSFTAAIQLGSGNMANRHKQDHELFGFFVTGFSSLECFSYAAYAIAAIVKPADFGICSDKDKRLITPKNTSAKYQGAFPGEQITTSLHQLIGSSDYTTWRDARNILAHRAAPGRIVRMATGRPAPPPTLKQVIIPLDPTTTASRLHWLELTLNSLMRDLRRFVRKHIH